MSKYYIIISFLLGAILSSIVYYGSTLRDYYIDQLVVYHNQTKDIEQLKSELNRMQEELIIVNAKNDELTERLNDIDFKIESWPKKK